MNHFIIIFLIYLSIYAQDEAENETRRFFNFSVALQNINGLTEVNNFLANSYVPSLKESYVKLGVNYTYFFSNNITIGLNYNNTFDFSDFRNGEYYFSKFNTSNYFLEMGYLVIENPFFVLYPNFGIGFTQNSIDINNISSGSIAFNDLLLSDIKSFSINNIYVYNSLSIKTILYLIKLSVDNDESILSIGFEGGYSTNTIRIKGNTLDNHGGDQITITNLPTFRSQGFFLNMYLGIFF